MLNKHKMSRYLKLILLLIFSTATFSACSLHKPTKAGLQIITNGVKATVFLNDQYLDTAPLTEKTIKPGTYQLKIQPNDPNLAPYETTIELKNGLLTVIAWQLRSRTEFSGGVIYEMEPIKNKRQSEVSFTTIPDGAVIKFNNQETQFSPIIITDVSPGNNEFEISLPSYETQKHTINVASGYRMLVTAKLAKTPLVNNQTTKTQQKIASKSANLVTQSAVLIKSTNFFQDGKEVLRVRDASNSASKTLGFVTVGQKYPYLKQRNNDWLMIEFEKQAGWISSKYASIIEP